jgi:S1-C subfamily serine protease
VGDVLVSLDGMSPTNVADLIDRVGRFAIGDEVRFVVRRGGQEKAIVVRVERGVGLHVIE